MGVIYIYNIYMYIYIYISMHIYIYIYIYNTHNQDDVETYYCRTYLNALSFHIL